MTNNILVDSSSSATMGLMVELEGKITIGKNVKIDIGAIIRGKIIVGDNVRIESYVKITGNGYIGNNSFIGHSIHNPQIGNHCIIKGEVIASILGDYCEIGENAQVERCDLKAKVKMKHFAGIRDANIGESTNISEGVTIANYDGVEKKKTIIGSYVMIGVHARIMGGIIIGDECFVADGARVSCDLPPRTYFNPEKTLKYPKLSTFKDNCAWYLYENYLVLDKSVGPKYRVKFVDRIVKKHGGDVEKIKQWLKTPIKEFGGRTPIQCIKKEGCEVMEQLCLNATMTEKETKKSASVLKLKEAVKNFVDNQEIWINTNISTGPLFGKTPKEIVEMEGENIIPLMVNFAKNKKIH